MNFTQALSQDELKYRAPSAFALTPYHKQSERYAFIPTSVVIEGMRNAGFVPVQASQSRTRIADKREYTKHMIRFRSAGQLHQGAIVGANVVEAVLINSHDGTSAYKLMAGVFRFVCTNGMVVADSMLESVNIKHSGNVIDAVVNGTQRIFDQAPMVMDTIQRWGSLQLTPAESTILATAAHTLRFPRDEDGAIMASKAPRVETLLSARRSEDHKNDLWTTFNRIQENTLKGMKTWQSGRRVTMRGVKGIDQDVRLNRALWTMAEEMAKLKGQAA